MLFDFSSKLQNYQLTKKLNFTNSSFLVSVKITEHCPQLSQLVKQLQKFNCHNN